MDNLKKFQGLLEELFQFNAADLDFGIYRILNVKKVKVRKDKGRKYFFSLGEKDGRNVACVWREYDDAWTATDF